MRVMALDIGTKNIGVAVSDETGILAQAKGPVRRTSTARAVTRIRELVEQFNVGEIVVGLPLNMNGTMGRRAEDSVKFAGILKQRTSLPVKLWDERLSTREAEAVMIEASVTRKKRKKTVDGLAAQIILQGYLDSLETERG
ncbi:MAG: Holliday junction resolvase RuvX [Candidatus Makaraimicrobium thalassicum]|nr:MAG: Holliday junction resolvase RuvX [Candidatus Omnitrophota bacterium]